MFGCLDDVVCRFNLLNLHMMYEPCVCMKKMFVGIIAGKPLRDFTRLLGMPRGLKGLLPMLNAIVSPTTTDLCFLFLMCFSFCFAKGLKNVSLGLFDECQILYTWAS
jgi:hypothetical protein